MSIGAVGHVLRRFVRSPRFAVSAITTLGVGLGVTAAMIALLDALLLRPPFHVARPDEVVRLNFQVGEGSDTAVIERTAFPTYEDVRDSRVFEDVAAFAPATVSIGRGSEARPASAQLITSNFFHLLGPRPYLGGWAAGESNVRWVVLSHTYWQRAFAGSSSAMDTTLWVDAVPYRVVAVAPAGFQSLSAGPIDVWLPMEHASQLSTFPSNWRYARERLWVESVARARSVDGFLAAQQRASAVLSNRRREIGDASMPVGILLSPIVPGRDATKPIETRVSLWLAGVSILVLLIACANLATLVLVRMYAQQREFLVRLMLGAPRSDLVRQAFADLAILVLGAMILAILLSNLVRNGVATFITADVPLARAFWDWRSTMLVAASALGAWVLLAVMCAGHLKHLSDTTRLYSRAVETRTVGVRTRRILMFAQATLCVILVFLAGLFAKSLRRAESLDLGADLNSTIQLTINFGVGRTDAEQRAAYLRARDVMAANPQVERVTYAEASPFQSGTAVGPRPADRTFEELWSDREPAYRSAIAPGFFAAVGAKSMRGREFTDADGPGAEPVVIVNAPLATHLWRGRDPLGECVWLDDLPTCHRVVGVIQGVWKFRALEREKMALYLSINQLPAARIGALFVRPHGDAAAFLGPARSMVQALNPDLPAVRAVVLRELVDPEFRPWRMGAAVFSAFAGVALLIAAVGIYGFVAVSSTLRTAEISVRMALGSPTSHILFIVLMESVLTIGAGLVAGSVLVLGVSRSLGGVLFQTSPTDLLVLIQTAFVLLVVSAAAAVAPTVRILRTNPANALRV